MQPPLTGRLLFYQSEPDRGMIMKLTQEQKRIKIAEACGWTVREFPDTNGLWYAYNYSSGHSTHNGGLSEDHAKTVLYPNYFSDLNACHKMESKLSDLDAYKYHEELTLSAMDQELISNKAVKTYVWNATAAQRAEALGLTLNLWKAGE